MQAATPQMKKPLGKRIFQSLLKLFPFDFRSDYGNEMEEVFDAQRADAEREGKVGIVRLWWETITGIFTTAPREHWEMLKQDVGYGLRMMARNKGFTAAAALTLGLGIGVNTAIFSVVYGVLLKPLPYGQGPQLIRVRQTAPKLNAQNIGFSEKELNDYRAQSKTLDQIAEYHSMPFILIGDEPRRVQTGVVSHYYFQMMGVRPIMGRDFTQEDEDKGQGEGVLLLSYRYWEKEFRGDESIVGRKFQMNNRPHIVIGVLPPLPGYPNDNDVYMPVSHCPFRSSQQTRENRAGRMTFMFARMKPGVSETQAEAELATIASRFPEQYPENYPRASNFSARVASLKEELTQNARQTFLILLGTAGLVLLIACANVANLMLSRVLRRERELGVRAALGASRVRLMRQLLTESVMLSLLGGVLGLALGASSTQLLSGFAARFTPRADEIGMDLSVLFFTLAVSVFTGMIFGSLPAMSSAQDVFGALRDGTRTTGGRNRVRAALIVAQVALSFVLLIGAGLMAQSFIRLQNTPGGYNPENVLSARIALNFTKYDTADKTRNFWRELFAKIEAQPDVVSYAVASEYPMLAGVSPGGTPFQIQSRPTQQGDVPNTTDLRGISAGYLRTVGVPLIAGRNFGAQDLPTSPQVVLVNQTFVRQFFPNQDAVGQRVSIGNPRPGQAPQWAEIIGVVGDVRQAGVGQEEYGAIYLPFEQGGFGQRILLRTTGDPARMIDRLRSAVREIDPHQPVESFQTLAQARSESLANPKLTSMLMGLFSVLALVITGTGITGVMALWVNQRTREIGIRMAMGASPGGVLGMVMRQGLLMVVIGVAVGVGGAYWLAGMIETLLFSIKAHDPATFAAVAALLLLCAATACWVPARRASRIDPIIALRTE